MKSVMDNRPSSLYGTTAQAITYCTMHILRSCHLQQRWPPTFPCSDRLAATDGRAAAAGCRYKANGSGRSAEWPDRASWHKTSEGHWDRSTAEIKQTKVVV